MDYALIISWGHPKRRRGKKKRWKRQIILDGWGELLRKSVSSRALALMSRTSSFPWTMASFAGDQRIAQRKGRQKDPREKGSQMVPPVRGRSGRWGRGSQIETEPTFMLLTFGAVATGQGKRSQIGPVSDRMCGHDEVEPGRQRCTYITGLAPSHREIPHIGILTSGSLKLL